MQGSKFTLNPYSGNEDQLEGKFKAGAGQVVTATGLAVAVEADYRLETDMGLALWASRLARLGKNCNTFSNPIDPG